MKKRTARNLEKVINTIYPVAIVSTFMGLEYFGVGEALRENEVAKLVKAGEFDGLVDSFKEYFRIYTPSLLVGSVACLAPGTLAAVLVAEPIKYFLRRK